MRNRFGEINLKGPDTRSGEKLIWRGQATHTPFLEGLGFFREFSVKTPFFNTICDVFPKKKNSLHDVFFKRKYLNIASLLVCLLDLIA